MLIKNILSLWAVQKPSHGLDITLRLEFSTLDQEQENE